ncbi:unnamed protein product [Chondrus crispus]|uniref:Uncharacterized protein n=1 Tax=Chondrus crispus TaxID=2769 RepID=R7Q3R8_CHOCR|nr:unnamed protein product [Chondrus crispus]CDF33182.1 unnamed protein product [Chondrus crispus]|eukprot:XP_005712985.1 unnamed protein product [Chondrus crispus]
MSDKLPASPAEYFLSARVTLFYWSLWSGSTCIHNNLVNAIMIGASLPLLLQVKRTFRRRRGNIAGNCRRDERSTSRSASLESRDE